MDTADIQAYLDAIERDATLREERHFEQRAETLDFLGFHVEMPGSLVARAENIRLELEAIDRRLFRKLRAAIREGG